MNRFTKVYTLYSHDEVYMKGLPSVLNITYIMQNYESREYMIEFKRTSTDQFRVFTDDSAFLNERKHNESFSVGSNTLAYVNGIVWEPIAAVGNTLTIATNRAGGVTMKSPALDTLDFFITRKLDNVNIDKGLPNRLDDIVESRHEFILNFDSKRGNAVTI